MILAVAGRRIDEAGARIAQFPAENVQMVGEALSRVFRTERATAVVSSAACGTDLTAQREAKRLPVVRRHIVLPYARAAFRASSVADRPGEWGSLFDEIADELQASGSLQVMNGQVGDDRSYRAVNEAILDAAQSLARAAGEEACAVIAWEGDSRDGGDLTEAFADSARMRGLRVIELSTLRTCFVVQGFGEKTDLATGRVLNLDASYEVIKEAVRAAGLRCVRADEIIHAGIIDKPMYEWLYRADLVIADLSTANVNAAYELGVRYGVRPRTTMIVAENGFKNPFDVSHIVTLGYEHLGKDVGRKEAQRFTDVLVSRIRKLMTQPEPDSPVYGPFLRLRPPDEIDDTAMPATAVNSAPQAASVSASPADWPQVQAGSADYDTSAKELLARAREALAADRFLEAKGLFFALHALLPRDAFVVQQLALTTYKSKVPDPVSALKEAHGYLTQLDPAATNDPETLGLWGAVHKRLWDAEGQRSYLDEAIYSYERGFYLKQDYYTGINYAFLLDVRARESERAGDRDEGIADCVIARRVRRQVLNYADRALAVGPTSDADRYWIVATQWEAAAGLEDPALEARFQHEAEALPVAGWMLQSTRSQLLTLRTLLAESPCARNGNGDS